MKLLTNLRFMFMLTMVSIMAIGCAEDTGTGGGTTDTPSTVDLAPGQGYITSATTITPGEVFTVNVQATAGTDEMNALSVYEDGILVDAARYTLNSVSADNNPRILFDTDRTSLDVDIAMTGHLDIGTKIYRFSLTDANQDEVSTTIEITTTGTPPVLTYMGTPDLQVSPEAAFNLNFTAAKTDGDIATIGVLIDGVAADLAGLEFDDVPFTANPQEITGDNTQGFDMKRLQVRAPAATGLYVYTVVLTDQFGLESTADINVNVGTPLTVITGALLNSSGPGATGGLDLETGMGTASGDDQAEIADLGINSDLPNETNWKQQIIATNGAQAGYLRANQGNLSESFSYESINNKEILAGLWDNRVEFTNNESDALVVGDIIIVQSGLTNFALLVTEVNTTPNDNSDNYVFTIKY